MKLTLFCRCSILLRIAPLHQVTEQDSLLNVAAQDLALLSTAVKSLLPKCGVIADIETGVLIHTAEVGDI